MPIFPPDRMNAIEKAAIACGLFDEASQAALLAGRDPAHLSSIPVPVHTTPAMRMTQALAKLTRDGRQVDGTVPLVVWLENAVAAAAGMQQAAPLEEALRDARAALAAQQPQAAPQPLPAQPMRVLFL